MSAPDPKDIRDAFKDYRNEWADVREEAAADMQAISPEGPWDPDDRDDREGNGRPCIHLDQINQFINQYVNNLRQTKRAIQAMPKGNGANDQDAKKRSSAIRGIEERSNAPTSVYIPAAQSAAERSYGFAVIRTEYKDDSSFDQEILIKPIVNPDTVLLNPGFKQLDASDVSDAFLLDNIDRKKFKHKYPNAEITDFSGEVMDQNSASDWVKDKYVQIAEYWKTEHDLKTLLLVEMDMPVQRSLIPADYRVQRVILKDLWEEQGKPGKVLRDRKVEVPRIVQYLTNGLEILDEVPWAGARIPIISCFGQQRWVTVGGEAKRQLLSLVRFARDPQLLLDFFASGECEEAGQIPKSPFVGAKGQFESAKQTWGEITKVPHAYVEYDLVADATGQIAAPPPSRPNWTPNFQIWEIAKDSAARALQASMGIAPLPTAAQRNNEKSGVALEKIQTQESIGSYHFLDNFENGFLHNMGWQINDLITPIIDTQQEMPVTQPDGTRSTMQLVGKTSHPINDEGAYDVRGLDDGHLHTAKGDFDVTISSGPSYQSERDEQSQFVDQLMQNMPNLPPPGSPNARVLALAIRMRPDLGPIGQQIADIFDPPPQDGLPPQAQAVIAPLKAQIQQLTQENSALHMEHAGKILEQQTKVLLQEMKNDNDQKLAQLANDIKVLIAEISAKSQDASQRAQMYETFWKENHSAAHDVGMQAQEQQHAKEMASQQAALQAEQVPDQQQPANGTPS